MDEYEETYRRRLAALGVPVHMPLPDRGVRCLYFVQASNGLIKVGRTNGLTTRLIGLQHMSPLPLALLAWTRADIWMEHSTHGLFREHNVLGEWFAPHPFIMQAVEVARSGQPFWEWLEAQWEARKAQEASHV